MERYFPWVEERLRSSQMPDDLKYVAIAESDLLPGACSPKGAAGPWQFMPRTACSYGLDKQGDFDERYDFERSSDCAFRYLSDLYRRFRNWPLAIAAYNCGEGRIQEEIRSQKVSDYFSLKLPQETERYVFRILAIKAVLGNPARYGYHLPKGQGYPELRVDKVNVALASRTSVQTLAHAAGISFRELKWFNPTLRSDDLPAGSYELKLPDGKGKVFEANFISARYQPDESSTPLREEKGKNSEPKSSPPKPEPAKLTSEPAEPKSQPASLGAKPAHTKTQVSEPKSEPTPPQSNPKEHAATPKETAATSHTVKKGETLHSIAQRYKVKVESLRRANNIKNNTVVLGQKLVIP